MLNGLKNFLQFINDNWTSIVVIVTLIAAIGQKIYRYLKLSKEEKIQVAKAQIEQIILKLITEAEVDYESWSKAGSIKRSQVIEQLFKEFPILSKVADQENLIQWIDEVIDKSLETLREIIKEQGEK